MEIQTYLLKGTFEDVYGPGLNPTNYTGTEYSGTHLTPTANNVYVYDCFFRDISYYSGGGALYCSRSVYKLLIEQSSFFSCKTSSSCGGGVYFDNTGNYESVLSKICSFDCSCGSNGQYAFINLGNNGDYKNHFNDSSITHSLKDGKNQYDSLFLESSTIFCPSNNFTNNECSHNPAFSCATRKCSTSETCRISYCSVVNNTANGGYKCIRLYYAGSTHCIDTCNILNNKQTSSEYGTITAHTNVLIKDSCILGNDEGNTVFYVDSSYKITISNCTVDSNRCSGSGSVVFTKTVQSLFINALSHLSTRRCDSYFYSYGTLTAKLNTPSRSSRFLISCNYKRSMADPLIGMELMFHLTMLPSNPYH
jgi:hypothetical protein